MRLNHLIYRVGRPLGGLQLARFLARKHPRILMYHRLNQGGLDGGLAVDTFRQQMRTVRELFNPISLDDLMQAHDRGAVPDNSVVITFDDGYHDFMEYAFPILKEEGIPVTLFVTTGFTSGDLWLWPDQLRYALENTEANEVDIPGCRNPLQLATSRFHAWNAVADHCLTLTNREKLQFMKETFSRLGVSVPEEPPAQYAPLRWDDVRSMVDDGLEVGSHSYSHPILTKLDDEELLGELTTSWKTIEDQLGRAPRAFCYPNGRAVDFDSRVQHAVRNAGYKYALAAFPDKLPLNDRLAINRYAIGSAQDLFEKTVFGLSYLGMDGSRGHP